VALSIASRRILAVTLIGVLAMTLVFPSTSYGQFGSIEGILDLINGIIQQTLNSVDAVSQALQALHEQIVWPVALIQRARGIVNTLIGQSRNSLQNIFRVSVRSATLQIPADLEVVMRNKQTNDFNTLTQAYYRVFGSVPPPTDADEMSRNLIDTDDALAVAALKTLKETDAIGDLILQSGNQIEDEARQAAPGSSPFLTAAAVASNIQSQAMMQKMLAAMIRQEAARVAHENTRRKRSAILVGKARKGFSDLLKSNR
jgi:hypothetical protein